MALNTSINTPYLALTGVVLISIVFIFAVLQPQIDSIAILRRGIAETTTALQMKQKFLETLGSKIQQLQTQAVAEQQLAVVIPETDMTQDVLRILGQYASQSGLVITGIVNSSSERQAQLDASIARGDTMGGAGDIRTISFQVQTSGTYPQLRDFLKALEKSPRLMNVVHVSMKQASAQVGQIVGTIDIQTYSEQH